MPFVDHGGDPLTPLESSAKTRKPRTRLTKWLAKIAGLYEEEMTPKTEEEYYLNEIAEGGGLLPAADNAGEGSMLVLQPSDPEIKTLIDNETLVPEVSGDEQIETKGPVRYDNYYYNYSGYNEADLTSAEGVQCTIWMDGEENIVDGQIRTNGHTQDVYIYAEVFYGGYWTYLSLYAFGNATLQVRQNAPVPQNIVVSATAAIRKMEPTWSRVLPLTSPIEAGLLVGVSDLGKYTLKSDRLPVSAQADAGKLVGVDNWGEYTLKADRLPVSAQTDAGKFVSVDSSGNYALTADRLPASAVGDAGKLIGVNNSGSYELRTNYTPDPETVTIGGTSYTATVRNIIVGTAELEDGVTSLPNGVVYLQIEG